MSKFAANLTMLFTEVPFLERFAAARDAGFAAVEFLFPLRVAGRRAGAAACASRALPGPVQHAAGQLGRGERGMAAIPGGKRSFAAHLPTVRDYALALGCTRCAMSGIVDPPAHSLSAHRQTLIDNIRFAADFLAAGRHQGAARASQR